MEKKDWKKKLNKIVEDNMIGFCSQIGGAEHNQIEQLVETEIQKAREEGRREALENLHLKLNDCVVYINDNGDIDNGVIGSVNKSIVEELSKLKDNK